MTDSVGKRQLVISGDSPFIAAQRERARALLDQLPADGGIYRHGPLCPCAGCVNAAVVRLVDPATAWPRAV